MQHDLPRPRRDDRFQHALMKTPITELISEEEVLVAKKSDSIEKIVKAMQKTQQSCVLIYERKHLVGILSQRDLLRKVAGKNTALSQVTAESLMTPKPEYVRAEDPIGFAVNKMAAGGYRRVPVISGDGTPLSIISIKDVFTYLSQRAGLHK